MEGVAQSFLRAAWTRADDNRLEFISFPLTPNSRVLSAQSSLHKPSLAEFRGQLHIAWGGTDGDAHLNVAPLDAGAWNEGRDPIDPNRVETLTELSMAAPHCSTRQRTSLGVQSGSLSSGRVWTAKGLICGAVVFP